jgi:hypothetical protein
MSMLVCILYAAFSFVQIASLWLLCVCWRVALNFELSIALTIADQGYELTSHLD